MNKGAKLTQRSETYGPYDNWSISETVEPAFYFAVQASPRFSEYFIGYADNIADKLYLFLKYQAFLWFQFQVISPKMVERIIFGNIPETSSPGSQHHQGRQVLSSKLTPWVPIGSSVERLSGHCKDRNPCSNSLKGVWKAVLWRYLEARSNVLKYKLPLSAEIQCLRSGKLKEDLTVTKFKCL